MQQKKLKLKPQCRLVSSGRKNGVLCLKLLMGSRFYCSAFCHVTYRLCPMLITVDHMLTNRKVH